jgi:hypothetical protein
MFYTRTPADSNNVFGVPQEAVTLFTRQDGYSVIINAIQNAKSIDLTLIHSIVDAVISVRAQLAVLLVCLATSLD